ncbi:acetolactate synthase 1, chloroplastic-like protein [Corchorus olitorius]|uniref:Acetolactate synthase 1, chloroplastic-like protein n=1 Tax=Corchorus olitorius TaxID=93759 RepID=A0A1R3L4Q5_9ROSI|nr:acetolactate synthase 1, chloroplastic-like protein [Corchorus olitorius]
MAAAAATTTFPKPSPLSSSFKSSLPVSKSNTLPFSTKLTSSPSLYISSSLSQSSSSPKSSAAATTVAPTSHDFLSRYAPDEPRKGADILVEALERQGVKDVFAYPGMNKEGSLLLRATRALLVSQAFALQLLALGQPTW